MTRNVGLIDRAARVVIGIALLGLYGALDAPWRYLTLVGLILIATGMTGACPLYGLLGWSTRRDRPGRPGETLRRTSGDGTRQVDDNDRTWPPEPPPPWRPSDPK